MGEFFINTVEFCCVGVLPIVTFLAVILFAGVLTFGPELLSSRTFSISKIAGFISGFVVFALVALVGSNEVVDDALSFQIPAYIGLCSAPILGGCGAILGWASIELVETFIAKRSLAFVIVALCAGGCSALYLYFNSQPPVRFGMAAGAIGYLLGSLGYIYFKGIEFQRFLLGQVSEKNDEDGDWPSQGRNIWY